jgi:hypothetical protein
MAEAGTVLVDGRRTTIYYHTGTVTRTRQQKQTPTAVHRELSIVDAAGRERRFDLIDMDISVREGDAVSVVWVVPVDIEAGPHILLYNHSTGDRIAVTPDRILPWFMKSRKVVWGTAAALAIAGMMISWVLPLFVLFAPWVYFRHGALKAIEGLFASPELSQLEAQLAQVKALPPAVAA